LIANDFSGKTMYCNVDESKGEQAVTSFTLDQRLADSGHFICDLPLCRVMLKNNRSWHWLVLVPRRLDIKEVFELPPPDRQQLIEEMAQAGQALKTLYNADKINTAAYGNMVPQLHIHVFARFRNDAAWPKPVWVVDAPEIPYNELEKETEIQKIRQYLEG
jgi:diadenosine tetraphosphate (Ap4A) HIT family hydrolase